ncbi:MAG: hypothetical protein L3J71_02520 [Victivallaceae bacterium]|nr:hypothetical protein [Victivallaceae bacterium]
MEKQKHVFIRESTHRKVKAVADAEGKKLKVFVSDLLDIALEYKKFLQKK